ncbi:MAG TPA: DUF4336 domain-containing protein [Alphaproteobacteria bacterium]|nr:DUF4336 domain-containing protein [Alphaproteobacteria bacterium]MDP6270605.1 DUF4336 domain-containing protein [Alphaproteobacteria bacterium]MDP7429366.1 DUF4336 domain-containing protein [Alphaproteobacteria bacterium]HJM49729.1 DUF4336 domain-containing protein [Alphaproteobacteria bacterium]
MGETRASAQALTPTLTPLAEAIWLGEGAIVDFYGFPYPTRCLVVRLADGGLWVWSPVELTADLRAEVEALGPVAHLVSPNKIHHLFLAQWREAFPQAQLWGPASTVRKRRDLQFEAALEDTPPAVWGPEIDQAWFQGSFFMDEIVFCHRPSATVIIADLSENFGRAFLERHWRGWQRAIAGPWGITEAHGYPPLEWRLTFWHRAPARRARAKVLGWQAQRVVMAHGEWQRTGGQAYLERAFSWLGN